jgi:hypothetical protein
MRASLDVTDGASCPVETLLSKGRQPQVTSGFDRWGLYLVAKWVPSEAVPMYHDTARVRYAKLVAGNTSRSEMSPSFASLKPFRFIFPQDFLPLM